MKDRSARGFTLLELMIVVIILGILAAIAVVSFTASYQQSKSSEVYGMMRDIAAKQEAYKAEFGQYLDVSGNHSLSWDDRRPENAPTQSFGFVWWDRTAAQPIYQNYRMLGFVPQGGVRFLYAVAAGLPGDAPGGDVYPAGLVTDTTEHWWVAVGFGNYDMDSAGAADQTTRYFLSNEQNVFGVVGGERE
jgi:prepilin-type N-terminal cleavage/methylation domain-containing protein